MILNKYINKKERKRNREKKRRWKGTI